MQSPLVDVRPMVSSVCPLASPSAVTRTLFCMLFLSSRTEVRMPCLKRRAAAVTLFALSPLVVPVIALPAMSPSATRALVERHAELAGVIKGRVTEKETGQPIQAAQVTVVVGVSRIGAMTDANGDYQI